MIMILGLLQVVQQLPGDLRQVPGRPNNSSNNNNNDNNNNSSSSSNHNSNNSSSNSNNSNFIFWGGVGCDSGSLYLQFPDPVARCLLRRWIGDPPETLNGLTCSPLSLMW